MRNRPVRVLIVDDRHLSRSAMEGMLDRQEGIEVLGGAVDGEDALAQVKSRGADIVLINSLAPTLDIVDTTKQLVTSCDDGTEPPRVLVLAHEVDDEALAAITVGASGVVLTSLAPEELVPAIRTANVGYLVLPPDYRWLSTTVGRADNPTTVGRADNPTTVGRADNPTTVGGPLDGALNGKAASAYCLGMLTDRENDVLRLLAIGCSNAQISNELVLSESTVKSHVQHILNKLGLPNRVHAVILAYELGLIKVGQNAPRLPASFHGDD
jgi:DNA-binding NarL/FixJ family response regulator